MYNHGEIDAKWQKKWEESGIFHAALEDARKKFYLLVEFPYPSGAGLHVGHPRSYTALDVIARKRRMQGENVLYPIGWDAFGLPAENHAIKTGTHPAINTAENIQTFKKQIQSLGISFDWSREIDTTDPKYYRWTQWMFNEFFRQGLCYKAKMPINWCPKDKIGLANEEAAGGVCERCGGPVEKREQEQWMIAMTKYADRLLEDLKTTDYLPKIKKEQEEWIGRSEGAEIDFDLYFEKDVHANDHRGPNGEQAKLTVFTTRPDTLFGVTYVVIAPEHLWMTLATDDHHDVLENKEEVKAYIRSVKNRTDEERTALGKEKTGVEVKGVKVVHPLTGERLPLWVADYVLPQYGTGVVMAVPAHDERDRLFALKYGNRSWFKLVIECGGVLDPSIFISGSSRNILDAELDQIIDHGVKSGRGYLVHSGDFDNLSTDIATEKIVAFLEEKNAGRKKVTYRLRDWVFSRQRYWGEPIPLVQCKNGCAVEHDGWMPVPDSELPVTLPNVERYEPTDTGESPLALISDWVNTKCPQCGGDAVRETDTMPSWAGSSWYFLRYADPQNDAAFASKEALKYWLPVDLYNGGMEHATRHLLYARFWTKVLFDRGYIPFTEFCQRRVAHGMILAEDGTKMSKSKGNVVNPDEIVQEFGADTLRVYELFIGAFDETATWSTNSLVGVRRFLDRVMRLSEKVGGEDSIETLRSMQKTLKKVTDDIEGMRFNTAVAALMACLNDLHSASMVTKESFALYLRMLVPFAPHVANELWEKIGMNGFVEEQSWPEVDESLLVEDEVTYVVQVNGKVRGNITVAIDATDEVVTLAAKADENVAKYLAGQEIKKVIIIPKKIVSFVV